jgi:hypothetical protein
MRSDSSLRRHSAVVAMVTMSSVAMAVCAFFIFSAAGTATADGPDDCPGTWDPRTQACIAVPIPGPPEAPDPSTGPGSGGPALCRDKDGTEVPCVKDGLTWWGSPHWCYAEPDDPQSPPPRGRADETGTWWTCQTAASGNVASFAVWWATGGQAPVDGEAVARELMVSIPYELADAEIAPPPTYHTYISYKNWLWVETGQWHPVTGSKSVRGATVTLTATPSYVEWDMGNGDVVSCVGAGSEWVRGMSEDAPTNCAYSYAEMNDPQGDTWTVSARINYTLGWTCMGNCGGASSGDLGSQLAAGGDATTITVYQRQTVVTN